ncbi:hypothetical protein N7495_001374, partial [Penicillium taxi]|uniref:uncharacterized protein n=1 Tax=Penicillium taxi TaxID=168475 RepID=UPI0025451B56
KGCNPATSNLQTSINFQPSTLYQIPKIEIELTMVPALDSMWEKYCLRLTGSTPTFIPVFLYGTAWKKDRTTDLVYNAIKNGFRGVDTAAQPRHYKEPQVGDGIRRAITGGITRREDLYLQTKFSPISAQDLDDMPYDPNTSVTEQVHASIRSSLHNLRPLDDPGSVDGAYIDTVVIHSPLPTIELTLEAWRALEIYVPHQIRNLGISNCDLSVLRELCTSPQVTVQPAVVQNRFYVDTLFDTDVRAFCRQNQIIYQSFWTLTANPELVRSTPVQQLADSVGISPASAFYALVIGLGGITVLNGTKNEVHMVEDLATPLKVEAFTREHSEQWQALLAEFQESIRETEPSS